MSRQLARSLYGHAAGLRALRRDDVWLASYPRSGNTRLRLLLGQLHLIQTGSSELVEPRTVDRLMPVLGYSDLSSRDRAIWVKTHRRYNPLLSRPDRCLYVERDPREAIASYYVLTTSRTRTDLPFADFVRSKRTGLPRWIAMRRTWTAVATATVDYSDMMIDPAAAVLDAFDPLGIVADPDDVRLAAELTSIERSRSAEASSGIRDSHRFDSTFRAVGPGDATHSRRLFTAELSDWVSDELARAGIGRDLANGRSTTPRGPTFRNASDVDRDEMRDLFERCDRAEVRDTFRAFELDAHTAHTIVGYTGRDEYFVADLDGRPVGFGMLRGWDEGYEIPSFGVFVDPEAQRRGVARGILDEAIERAQARGSERVRLTVDHANERAARLYRRAGFVLDDGASTDEQAVMWLDLEAR